MIVTNQKRTELEWGPWLRHVGGGMPVPYGTIVEVITLIKTADGVTRKIGIAGVDLIRSWDWIPDIRKTHPAAPIDYYRIKYPEGMCLLKRLLADLPELEDA
tara:strand:- start:48 stop:353 length:306 start_codon:yes stop_codon:yes gene_type:complete